MEASLAGVLIFLMAVGLSSVFSFASSKDSLQLLQLIDCVFYERVNVTCRWKHKNASRINYTLMIWEGMWQDHQPDISLLNCTTTSTNCTVEMDGLTSREVYCIAVTAHMSPRDISSRPRCQSGRTEVKLSSVVLKYVMPLRGSSQCLSLEWYHPKPSEFPVSKEDIKSGLLISQIEFRAQGEHRGQVKNVSVTALWFTVCGFRPNTTYDIKLRHRFQSEASPWSEWSKPVEGRTGEAAPSAAPVFWRRVRQSSQSGQRLVTLLWKPLPLANGRVLFYNVTCRTEGGAVLSNPDGCRRLGTTETSCSLHLPVDRCSCTLTASNSGGASPQACLWLPEASEQAPSALSHVSVNPLNDSSLAVGWAAPVNVSVSGFVVEWFAVGEGGSSDARWEKLNPSSRTLIITGLKPMERYTVSVRALCGEQQVTGENRTQLIYTREGAPSAGPNITVIKTSSHSVELSWNSLPVDQLRGFLQNYSLYITTRHEPSRNLTVAGGSDTLHALENLSPGNYRFSVGANTGGGSGPAGTGVNVHIASEIQTVTYVLLSLILTSLLLALMAVLHFKMMNKEVCKAIPDPSHSSLSHWIPKTDSERKKQLVFPDQPEVKFSEVLLLGEWETPDPEPDRGYRSSSYVQTYSCKQTESALLRNLSEVKTLSIPNLATHPLILSNVHYSLPLKNLPPPHSTLSVGDGEPLPGGAVESPDHPPAYTFCPRPKQHQSLGSLSNLSSVSHPCLTRQAEVTSPEQPVTQTTIYSFLSLQHNILRTSTAPSDTLTPPTFPPFSNSIFMDPSYCPLQCDPYIPFDA